MFCEERWTPPRRRGSGTPPAPAPAPPLSKEATRGTLRRVSRCFVTLCIDCMYCCVIHSADIKNQHITCHSLIYICFLTYLSHHLLHRSPFVVLPWRGRQRRFGAFHQQRQCWDECGGRRSECGSRNVICARGRQLRGRRPGGGLGAGGSAGPVAGAGRPGVELCLGHGGQCQ